MLEVKLMLVALLFAFVNVIAAPVSFKVVAVNKFVVIAAL